MHPRERRRLNILYVITSSDVGGEEQHLLQLARYTRDCGHQVRVCCLRHQGRTGRQLEEEGFPLVCFNEPETPSFPALLQNARRLAAMVRDHRIDLIHSFLVRANLEVRLAGRMAGVTCAIVNSEGCINLRKSGAAIWLDRHTVRWCDIVIANSWAVADVLMHRERVPSSKVRIVYQGIDVARFKNARRTIAPAASRDVVVGYVGRLHPEKGVRYLVEAAAQVARVTTAFRIVLVGDGVEAPSLRALVDERGLSDRVHFAGMQQDIPAFMRTFDVLAIPSIEEGLPTVAMEALACGVPIVATAVGGTAEVNEHGRTGLLVPPADTSSLARALVRLITDRSLRQQLGRNGPRLAEEKFQMTRMFVQTAAAYDEVLQVVSGKASSAA